MRILLLLRGAPGCGKSTWIEQNGFKPYTLSADDIRMQCSSPILTADGGITVNQENNHTVWQMLFQLLEMRMRNGDFTVIDATNSKTSEMNQYKNLCETYRYRMYCVDFTTVPIEVVKQRNASRLPMKRVPEAVIDGMYARFQTQKIPSGITVLRPDEIGKIRFRARDLSAYKKVHHIGDVHGCYTALRSYFDAEGGIKDDEFYIFCGDYVDRGLENVQTVEFLLSVYDRPNVALLEGNHERWLWEWANGGVCASKEFELVTKTQLENANVDKKRVRAMYRKLSQCVFYSYGGCFYLVTHGGLSRMPQNLIEIPTKQMIKGVGDYNDAQAVADAFAANTPENYIQIHGHRNPKCLPTAVNDRVYNLEGQVEFGGCLRCVQVAADGTRHVVEIKNDVFAPPKNVCTRSAAALSVGDLVQQLRRNKNVKEKRFGDISSFNFTKEAFLQKAWDAQTDALFVATKSEPDGIHTAYLRELLDTFVTQDAQSRMKVYAKTHNVSFVFECVDMEHDPHIIDYAHNGLYLLDIVYNEIVCRKYPYDRLCETAAQFGLRCKEKAYTLERWQDFFDWYFEVTAAGYRYNGRNIEGFVLEDADGDMLKLKIDYYNFWKFLRSVTRETLRNGYADKRKVADLRTPLANQYYAWVKTLAAMPNKHDLPQDICALRRMFYASEAGQPFKE